MPLRPEAIQSAMYEFGIERMGEDVAKPVRQALQAVFCENECKDEDILRSVTEQLAANTMSLRLLAPDVSALRYAISVKFKSALSAVITEKNRRKKSFREEQGIPKGALGRKVEHRAAGKRVVHVY